jgi:serine/threonine-protein kinase
MTSPPPETSLADEPDSWSDETEPADAEDHGSDLTRTVALTAVAAPPSDDDAVEMEGCLLGQFRLVQQITRGGMGLIFRAMDLQLDRPVAVKLLRRCHAGDDRLRQQLVNEARIMARLQHPGILPIYGTGTTDDDRPYLAMKLVYGMTLAEMLECRESPADDLPRLLKIFEQISQTVAYSHACGVVHLDIKPGNVMAGRFGEVHLMDWGLAQPGSSLCPLAPPESESSESAVFRLSERIAPHELAASLPDGIIWGTPSYMAPEQARGQCTDVRSDVFGLGGILCEILTGRPPYVGVSLVDLCYKATRADLGDAMKALTDCQADSMLVRLVQRCLSPDPAHRPPSAAAVAAEMTLYLESLHQHAARDLAQFFELNLDLFCIAGFDGHFRRINPNFSRVLGYTDKQLMSHPFISFVHPDDRERTNAEMRRLIVGDPVVKFRNRYLTSSGHLRVFEWTAKSVPKDQIIFAVARDVTPQGGLDGMAVLDERR